MIPTIRWVAAGRSGGPAIRILDQTCLPEQEVLLELVSTAALTEAIAALRIRGAPAIGIAGAYGVAQVACQQGLAGGDPAQCDEQVLRAAERLRAVRPTAVNLARDVDRVWSAYRTARDRGRAIGVAGRIALGAARGVHADDLRMSRRMGRIGAELVRDGARILTHCNTGGLATGGLGTALAVVTTAARAGRVSRVFVDETRPLLQGARLTVWELMRSGIAATLLVDGAAAWCLARQRIDMVLVGADRVAANGDVANKIGTYGLALAAVHHRVPFLVVAPSSSFDLDLPSGECIEIEERSAEEVCRLRGTSVAPPGAKVWNPAFDVTPAQLITGWITERGVLQPPFGELAGRSVARGQLDIRP